MIKHIVAWDFPEEGKKQNIRRMKNLLEELPGLIPEIMAYEIGVNIKDSEFAKDMILISVFKDVSALQTYSDHSEHQRVVQELRKVAKKTVVVDFET
ncbi:MAG: Dabb family protein [Candidatus Marinimicrobia bacterium]|nr:Dabb family protein [Candidatus Neomarinimicrobiota bacterium]